jgi:hypothetical protein
MILYIIITIINDAKAIRQTIGLTYLEKTRSNNQAHLLLFETSQKFAVDTAFSRTNLEHDHEEKHKARAKRLEKTLEDKSKRRNKSLQSIPSRIAQLW